jgi:hypothetical protein
MEMDIWWRGMVLCLVLAVGAAGARAQFEGQQAGRVMPAAAEQLFALANAARAANGAGPLKWDGALADAARQHCLRMAAEGPISHRYGGEADLSDRAGQAGAHFSLVEENVAFGPTAAEIQDSWMHSPGHRSNLLNPEVDRVGIAVVAARGELYAVEDFARGVEELSPSEVEARVAALIRPSGVAIVSNPAVARQACMTDHGVPGARSGAEPRFVMRWQGADLNRLPQALVEKLSSGQIRQAAVGSCPPQVGEGDFTAYRVAVLLY